MDSLLYPKPTKKKKKKQKDILISDYVICQTDDDYLIDKHHIFRRPSQYVIKIGHNAHMMLHFDPVNFRKSFGSALFYDLLPRLKDKHEYIAKLKDE